MRSTPHFTVSALQADDAHSYMAEKRNIPLSCKPTLPSLWWFTLRPLLILCFLFFPLFPLYLFSFYSISEKSGAVSPWLFFFMSWIHFLSQVFSVSPGNLQLPNSRWHLKYTSAPVSYCLPRPSLRPVIECGFPHIQMYAPHFHIYTQNCHTLDRSSSISLCFDALGTLPPNQSSASSYTLHSGTTHWDIRNKFRSIFI